MLGYGTRLSDITSRQRPRGHVILWTAWPRGLVILWLPLDCGLMSAILSRNRYRSGLGSRSCAALICFGVRLQVASLQINA